MRGNTLVLLYFIRSNIFRMTWCVQIIKYYSSNTEEDDFDLLYI